MDRGTYKNRHSSHNNYDLSADLARIKDAFADASFDVKGKASEVLTESLQTAKQKSNDLQHSMAKYIAKKPFKTLGVATLIGFILGYFFRK